MNASPGSTCSNCEVQLIIEAIKTIRKKILFQIDSTGSVENCHVYTDPQAKLTSSPG